MSDYCSSLVDGVIRAEVIEGETLNARSVGFAVGQLEAAVHRCNSPLHRYSTSRSSARPAYSLYLLTQGSLTITSDNAELSLRPGDMAFFHPRKTAEFRAPAGGNTTISFRIPWRLAHVLASGREIALNRVFSKSSGIGACVASLMETVAERQHDLTIEDRATLQTVLAEAIIQLGTSRDGGFEQRSRRGETLRHVKAIVAASLDDPELTPAGVAKRAGISVRSLHRLFHASGETFWSWVRDQRLDRCQIELVDPSLAGRSITEVALRWGFNELSTFDRNFRKRFGTSPRVMRAANSASKLNKS